MSDPKTASCGFAAGQPDERWRLDITRWSIADGIDVESLNFADDHARPCAGSDALAVFKAHHVSSPYSQLFDQEVWSTRAVG